MLAVQQVAAGGRGLASGLRISQSMFPVTHFIVFTGLEVSRGGGAPAHPSDLTRSEAMIVHVK